MNQGKEFVQVFELVIAHFQAMDTAYIHLVKHLAARKLLDENEFAKSLESAATLIPAGVSNAPEIAKVLCLVARGISTGDASPADATPTP
ncbi:hypothetical protein [Paraburkholderia caffeinilytica]|uniref:hypothetical protein n=1 Tax=Paraburkholderia caffeinilytica TaxID=1761016 RepID=UPI003DA18515